MFGHGTLRTNMSIDTHHSSLFKQKPKTLWNASFCTCMTHLDLKYMTTNRLHVLFHSSDKKKQEPILVALSPQPKFAACFCFCFALYLFWTKQSLNHTKQFSLRNNATDEAVAQWDLLTIYILLTVITWCYVPSRFHHLCIRIPCAGMRVGKEVGIGSHRLFVISFAKTTQIGQFDPPPWGICDGWVTDCSQPAA